MKKLIGVLTLISMFMFIPLAFGATLSSWTETSTPLWDINGKIVTLVWTAHDTNAGVSAYQCTSIAGDMLDKIIVDPSGTTAPTALYDILINDVLMEYDVLGGKGSDMVATGDGVEIQLYRGSGMYGSSAIGPSGVSVHILNNSANVASGTIHLILRHKEGGS